MARHAGFAPDFRVQINGEPLPAAVRGCITGINYQNGLEGADRVELSVANPGLRWLDHPLFQIDNPFELSLGYAPDPLEKVFVGEITGVNVNFPSGGMPTLTAVAHDFMHRMTEGAKDRDFAIKIPCFGVIALPDPLVVSLVSLTDLLIPYPDPVGAALSFLTLLLTYVVDPLEAQKSIRKQQGQSDFDFLTEVAKQNGWEMYIDHTLDPQGYILRFQFLVQDYSPSLTLKYGESLIEFAPRITTVGQVAGVSARIWVAAIQMEFVIVLSWDYDRAAFDLAVYPGLGSLESLLGSQSRGVLKLDAIGPATAPRKILGELLPRLNNRVTGSGRCLGDLRLRAGRVIDLEGLGEQFSGLWRITSANFTLDGGGFNTSFEVRKEIWFGSIPTPKGASGLLRIQGQTIR
jgi:hypothetical protein